MKKIKMTNLPVFKPRSEQERRELLEWASGGYKIPEPTDEELAAFEKHLESEKTHNSFPE